MSASALLKKARQAGISFTVADSKLRLEADDEPPAELVEAIIRQKTEIIALITKDALEERKGMASDSVPERYLDAWGQFQCQCPGGVTEQAWRRAIDDAGRFLAQWGALADTFGWSPGDLFDVPRDGAMGLVWWLKGRTVTALGPEHAGVGEPAYDRVTRREWINPYVRPVRPADERLCLNHRPLAPRSGHADHKDWQGFRHGAKAEKTT
jgi:hypothetical protein